MIEIITATRLSEKDFWDKSALGISLKRVAYNNNLALAAAFENQRGLSEIYNERIPAGDPNNIIVFIHDDVWIDDCFFAERIIEGLKSYDVLGIAGSQRTVPFQPGWGYTDKNFTMDTGNLSGLIAHGEQALGQICFFGAVPADCELLDGVFLAARKDVLINNKVLFDSQFKFHFYDLDFCRTARQRGLRLGTWAICLTHQSSGAFGSPDWVKSYHAYIEKWGS
jgi:GT2 family glycosyltransferase